jgi:hypothetical protein
MCERNEKWSCGFAIKGFAIRFLACGRRSIKHGDTPKNQAGEVRLFPAALSGHAIAHHVCAHPSEHPSRSVSTLRERAGNDLICSARGDGVYLSGWGW